MKCLKMTSHQKSPLFTGEYFRCWWKNFDVVDIFWMLAWMLVTKIAKIFTIFTNNWVWFHQEFVEQLFVDFVVPILLDLFESGCSRHKFWQPTKSDYRTKIVHIIWTIWYNKVISIIGLHLEVNLDNWPQIDFSSTKYQFSNVEKRNWAYSEIIWTMKILRFTGLNSFIRESSKCQGLNQI